MENYEIPQNEFDSLESLEDQLHYDEIAAETEMDDDEYPFPHVFKFQALAMRTMLANPDHSFEPIEKLKHIFSESIDDEAFPTLYQIFWGLGEEDFGDPEIGITLPNYYCNFHYIKINGKSAIFYEGCDGNSSTNFSFWGAII